VAKKFKDSKIQEFKNSKIQEFKDSKTQGFKKVFCGFQCSDSYRNRYRAWWSRLRSKVWWSRSDSYRNRSRVWWSRLRSTTSNKIQNSIPWLSVFPRFSGNLIQSFVSRSLSGSWPLIHKFKDSKIQGFKDSRKYSVGFSVLIAIGTATWCGGLGSARPPATKFKIVFRGFQCFRALVAI